MTSALLVDVVYVGSKSYKEDNICKTGAVWFGYGDSQKIERKYIPILLKHPDVWMLKTEFDNRGLVAETSVNRDDQAPKPMPSLSANFTFKAEQEKQAQADSENTQESQQSQDNKPAVVPGLINSTAVPTATLEEIKGAIVLMLGEKEKEGYFTDKGRPRVDSVRALCGKDVDMKMLNEAWSLVGSEG